MRPRFWVRCEKFCEFSSTRWLTRDRRVRGDFAHFLLTALSLFGARLGRISHAHTHSLSLSLSDYGRTTRAVHLGQKPDTRRQERYEEKTKKKQREKKKREKKRDSFLSSLFLRRTCLSPFGSIFPCSCVYLSLGVRVCIFLWECVCVYLSTFYLPLWVYVCVSVYLSRSPLQATPIPTVPSNC